MASHRLRSLTFCCAALCFACGGASQDKAPPAASEAAPAHDATQVDPVAAKPDETPAPTDPSPPAKADGPKVDASCTNVLATLAVKEAAASLSFTAEASAVPLEFEPDTAYESNPIWDAGNAPSMCAAVLQPPAVAVPMLTWVGQFKVGDRPGLRLQATGVVMGERDLAGPGEGMFTGSYLAQGAETTQALNFTAGKVTLARGDGGSSQIKLTFAGATGELVPGATPFTLDGTITATVGAR